jgi:beta-galactosidase
MGLYRDAVMGAYRLLTDRDVAVEVLHEHFVSRDGVPSHITSLYWPMPSVASAELIGSLAEFVEGGGTLVSEAGPGEYASSGHRRPSVPAEALATVFGVSQVETTTPRADERITVGSGELAVAWQVESTRVVTAEVVGTFVGGGAAVTSNEYGRGRALLVSSYPSLAYGAAADEATALSLVGLLGTSSGSPDAHWASQRPGLLTRRARSREGRDLVFAINWTRHAAVLNFGDTGIEVAARTGRLLQYPSVT